MVDFFHMGFNRLLCWAVFLVPAILFADFTSLDSDNLSYIQDVMENNVVPDVAAIEYSLNGSTGIMRTLVNGVYTKAGFIADDADSMRVTLEGMDSELDNIDDLLTGIQDYMYYYKQAIIDRGTNNKYVRVIDESLSNSFSQVSDKLDAMYEQDLVRSNQLDTVISSLENMHFSAFTNYYAYLPFYGFNVNQLSDSTMSLLFKRQYGYTPNASQLTEFKSFYRFNNRAHLFAEDVVGLAPQVPLSFDSGAYYTYRDSKSHLTSMSVNSTSVRNLTDVGLIRNYWYGTRQLTDDIHAVTNSILELSSFRNPRDGDYISSQGSVAPGGVFSSVVGGIKDSLEFTGEVGTNVVGSVLQGAIPALADNSYGQKITQLEQSRPSDESDSDSILSELSTITGAIDDFVESASSPSTSDANSNAFVIPANIFFPNFGSVDLTLRIQSVASHMVPAVDFVVWGLQVIMCIYFFNRAWNDVLLPTMTANGRY